MARTTAEYVGGIIEVDPTITDLSPFILTANELVTELCAPSGYSTTRLELIERWLAAHFYAIRDPRVTGEGAGPVNARYESKVDLNLNLTRYGQQALALDTKGGLAALNQKIQPGKDNAKPRVGVMWAGPECELPEDTCPL